MAATGTDTLVIPSSDNPMDRLRQAMARLSNAQKISLMVACAAIIALLVVSSAWLKQSDYRILFSNIEERDGGAIIAALDQMNIPYSFSDSGSAILIPSNKVHEVRLRLATQGLPKGGGVGFELMENQKFGVSQFAEQVNYQRGLEGELSRTIQSIAAVQAARVHLAIPKSTVFVREEVKPSASVLLNLYPGRQLDPAQIAGVQNLVAASVPNLTATNVTLIDQNGAMLSQLKSRLTDAGLDATQIKYVQEIEASAIKRVVDILAPLVGPDNARVQVAADIDFSQSEQTAETHRPNTTPPDISIRSQQINESANGTATALGIPGALTNQPPVPATAPITTPAVAGAPGTPTAGQIPIPGQINAAGIQAPISSVGQPISTRKDSLINYEVDKTIRHSTQAIGSIKRLSAAVVINHRKDAKGVVKALADPELKQINDLIKEALGFNQERGDSVSVANAPFTEIEKTELATPLWKDPENVSFFKEIFKYGLIALIIAYLLLKVVRPLVRVVVEPPALEDKTPALSHQLDALVGESEGAGDAPAPVVDDLTKKLESARDLARENPKVIANIINNWTGAHGNG